jgi:hypothetical protein
MSNRIIIVASEDRTNTWRINYYDMLEIDFYLNDYEESLIFDIATIVDGKNKADSLLLYKKLKTTLNNDDFAVKDIYFKYTSISSASPNFFKFAKKLSDAGKKEEQFYARQTVEKMRTNTSYGYSPPYHQGNGSSSIAYPANNYPNMSMGSINGQPVKEEECTVNMTDEFLDFIFNVANDKLKENENG